MAIFILKGGEQMRGKAERRRGGCETLDPRWRSRWRGDERGRGTWREEGFRKIKSEGSMEQ